MRVCRYKHSIEIGRFAFCWRDYAGRRTFWLSYKSAYIALTPDTGFQWSWFR